MPSKAIVNHPQFYQFYGWYSINHQSTWVVYDIALLTRYPILSCHCFFLGPKRPPLPDRWAWWIKNPPRSRSSCSALAESAGGDTKDDGLPPLDFIGIYMGIYDINTYNWDILGMQWEDTWDVPSGTQTWLRNTQFFMEFLMGKHLEMADFPLPGLITGGQNRNIELAPPTSQWLPYCIVFQSHEMIGHWFHPGRLVLGSLRNLIILFTSGWWKKKSSPGCSQHFAPVGVFHGIFHHNELRSGATLDATLASRCRRALC